MVSALEGKKREKAYKLVRLSNGKTQPYGRDVRSTRLCQQDNQPSFTWPAIPENWQPRGITAAAASTAQILLIVTKKETGQAST